MKKLKLNLSSLGSAEVLTRDQLKKVMGGSSLGSLCGSGCSGICNTTCNGRPATGQCRNSSSLGCVCASACV